MPLTKVIKPRSADGSLYRCACCGRLTLQERGAEEVCHICFWQDEGQDDPFASDVWAASNGKLSLTQARQNFVQCGAYDPRIGSEPGRAKPVFRLKPPTPPLPALAVPASPPWWSKLSR